ncbi:MAG: YaiI/YqxD family protein [Chlamydiae bacterium]|nr:YaiI/YqxD family protein [Chlamydiota bacterium]
MPKHKPNTIWIDADACPKAVKELIFKVSRRLNISVILVANSYQIIPQSNLIKLTIVDKGFDAADQHIIDLVEIHDIVITADIPLAAKILKKKAKAINPRGEIYNENNIGSILSMRNFMKEFYDAGSIMGGPPAFGPRDMKQFADSLNKLLS